ncbi:hypothetical protein [Allonocardiopsis opalescens]|uniref:Uncharacterized protein n=1 Tax=Allonocardiopsis opalescens TaxID=1144618 RepID=A0A2T0Q7T1_9ACTN|nr:hypothetical protein [Allonocardiopsis opalescens]PRX99907.1 hypothetical protein CLV72_103514 [Allonocardiopsis opalescens]
MYVIRLADGRLLVPRSAVADDGTLGDAYEEVGPDHPEYARLAEGALTEEEWEERRRGWREGDESLRRQFEEWRAGQEP